MLFEKSIVFYMTIDDVHQNLKKDMLKEAKAGKAKYLISVILNRIKRKKTIVKLIHIILEVFKPIVNIFLH